MYKSLIFAALLLFLVMAPGESSAQFKQKKQGMSALNYHAWIQKQNEFKGFSTSRKELKILGKKPSEVRSNNRKRNKKSKNKE